VSLSDVVGRNFKGVNQMYAINDNRMDELTKVCQSLQFLNSEKYCKSPHCNPVTRMMIYNKLKPPVIEDLCERGLCIHATPIKRKIICNRCNGSGLDVETGFRCNSCTGTGIYSSWDEIAFQFCVCRILYGWHLPCKNICFKIPSSFMPEPYECIDPPSLVFEPREAIQNICEYLKSQNYSIRKKYFRLGEKISGNRPQKSAFEPKHITVITGRRSNSYYNRKGIEPWKI
jgi:hypothetical protein